jgi:hypothetical protein
MLDPTSLFSIFTNRFSEIALDYMITGSAAGIAFGEPRLTHDLDVVLRLPRGKIAEFIKLFPESDFYCPPEEIIVQEIGRPTRGHINLLDYKSGFKADIYFAGTEPLQKWGLANRKAVQVDGIDLYFAPINYVILYKLKYLKEGGSEKHTRDILGLLRVSRESIDLKELSAIAEELDLSKILDQILSEAN